MVGFKRFAGLAAIAIAASAVPAQALVFATYEPIQPTSSGYSDIRWVNSGTQGSNGTSGTIFSTSLNGFSAAGSRAVSFSFLLPALSPVATNITALFTLSGGTPDPTIATLAGTTLTQGGVSGTFSFISTSTITVGSTVYAAGSNLLTGTYGNAQIVGEKGGSTATFSGGSTVLGQTLTFTSDFLDFSTAGSSDFDIALDSVRSVLTALPAVGTPTKALRTFRSGSSGEFSTGDTPIVVGVPEPQTWGLMVLGFGMVGLQARRRSRSSVTA